MTKIRLATKGLTLKEVRELTALLQEVEGIEQADWQPDLLGKPQYRSQVVASIPEFLVILKPFGVKALEGAAGSVGALTTAAVWKRVEKALDEWKAKRFSGPTVVPVAVTLYGPDDKPLKMIEGKR